MGVDIWAVTESKVLLHFDRSSGDDDIQKHVSEMHNMEGLPDKNIRKGVMLDKHL